jgi:hypothetical protein
VFVVVVFVVPVFVLFLFPASNYIPVFINPEKSRPPPDD